VEVVDVDCVECGKANSSFASGTSWQNMWEFFDVEIMTFFVDHKEIESTNTFVPSYQSSCRAESTGLPASGTDLEGHVETK